MTALGPWPTIGALIDESCAKYADLEALVDGDVRLTYRDYAAVIDRAAKAHIASGLGHGERFTVLGPNFWKWPIAALGGHKIGSVLVPVNTRFRGREIVDVVRRAKSRILFCTTDFLDTDFVTLVRDAVDGDLRTALPDLQEIVVLSGPVPEGCVSFEDYLARADSVSDDALAARAAAVTPDDLCHILFTSGTTGAPKGAMLQHGTIMKVYDAWATCVGMRTGDRFLVVYPYLHSSGLNSGILACMMRGATNVPHAVFDVPSLLQRVREERISVIPSAPSVFQSILNTADLDLDALSSMRLAITGAAAVPEQMILDMKDKLGFETVAVGYGLTECSGTATMTRYDDPVAKIANSSGRPIPDVEVRIAAPDGTEVPRGDTGEIWIRGYNVMLGYLDDPEQTAEAIDADGWLHSGDVGYTDADGYVQITDRLKDMFIVGGFNAYPVEIERMMLDHPDIGAVTVIGIPDDRLGEVGMAFVIPRPGSNPTEADIVAWCRKEMANYKVPRRVAFVDAFPLNASGKVLKTELRARVRAGEV
jgi:acyl-CoA synthetase (AMP-forming)/AMP-acid ligase II